MRRHTDAERQSRESLFCAQALGTEGSSSRGSARVRRGQWPEGEKLEPLVGFLQEGLGEAGQAGVGTAVPSNFGRLRGRPNCPASDESDAGRWAAAGVCGLGEGAGGGLRSGWSALERHTPRCVVCSQVSCSLSLGTGWPQSPVPPVSASSQMSKHPKTENKDMVKTLGLFV